LEVRHLLRLGDLAGDRGAELALDPAERRLGAVAEQLRALVRRERLERGQPGPQPRRMLAGPRCRSERETSLEALDQRLDEQLGGLDLAQHQLLAELLLGASERPAALAQEVLDLELIRPV